MTSSGRVIIFQGDFANLCERLLRNYYQTATSASGGPEPMEGIQTSGSGEPPEHVEHIQQPTDIIREQLEQSYRDISQLMVAPITQALKDEVALIPHLIQHQSREPDPKTNEQIASLQAEVLSLESGKQEMDNTVNELKQKLSQAKEEKESQNEELRRLQEQNKTFETTVATLQRERAESNAKIKNLHRMMIRTPHKDETPMDDDIRVEFHNLKDKILQLVKNHFAKPFEPKGGVPPNASSDYLELLVRSRVAGSLYEWFFDSEVCIFGIGGELEGWLKSFEIELKKSNSGVEMEDAIEWQVCTARAAKALNPPERPRRIRRAADYIFKDLTPSYHHSRYTPKERSKAMSDLEEVCGLAYNLALLFRCNKIEYLWEQRLELPPPLEAKDLEILGTEGPDLNQPHRIARIIFGGVVKGDRATGRLKDGQTRISKVGVLIGHC